MTVKQAAAHLRTTRNNIEQMIHRGRLKPLRMVHRRILLRRSDVERLLGKH